MYHFSNKNDMSLKICLSLSLHYLLFNEVIIIISKLLIGLCHFQTNDMSTLIFDEEIVVQNDMSALMFNEEISVYYDEKLNDDVFEIYDDKESQILF